MSTHVGGQVARVFITSDTLPSLISRTTPYTACPCLEVRVNEKERQRDCLTPSHSRYTYTSLTQIRMGIGLINASRPRAVAQVS